MKKIDTLFLLSIVLLYNGMVAAQSCFPEGITFSTQSQIDNFPANYPNCSAIGGDVIVSGEGISNLDSLQGLNAIGGNALLIEDNPNLVSIAGLGNINDFVGLISIKNNPQLTSLTGLNAINKTLDLTISNNHALTSLDGLNNIQETQDITISNNPNLTSLDALGNITQLNGLGNQGIEINNNDALTSLNGLDNIYRIPKLLILENDALTSLEGLKSDVAIDFLVIRANSALESLTGLEAISVIREALIIKNNDALTSLNGLNNLTAIRYWDHGFLEISDNDALASLNGLENLHSIGSGIDLGDFGLHSLYIENNASLTTLDGLDNLEALYHLRIQNNPSLSFCNAQRVCNFLQHGGNALIEYNAADCNSEEEVLEACGPVSIDDVSHVDDPIQIFPNPATDYVQVNGIGLKNWTWRAWNITGKPFIVPKTAREGQLDLSSLSGGVYFLEFRNSEHLFIKKIIKE